MSADGAQPSVDPAPTRGHFKISVLNHSMDDHPNPTGVAPSQRLVHVVAAQLKRRNGTGWWPEQRPLGVLLATQSEEDRTSAGAVRGRQRPGVPTSVSLRKGLSNPGFANLAAPPCARQTPPASPRPIARDSEPKDIPSHSACGPAKKAELRAAAQYFLKRGLNSPGRSLLFTSSAPLPGKRRGSGRSVAW